NRLDGVAKAQVSTNLAAVYLMNRQPEEALKALWSSRTTLLPTAMNLERRALEARALMELERYDHALEVLGKDASPAARDVRADILWKQQQWGAAAALYEQRLGDRWKETAVPLSEVEETRLIRAGAGYSLARDAGALSRLSKNYARFAEGARSPGAIRVALAGLAARADRRTSPPSAPGPTPTPDGSHRPRPSSGPRAARANKKPPSRRERGLLRLSPRGGSNAPERLSR